MSKLKLLFTCPTFGATTVSPFYFLVNGQDYTNSLGGGHKKQKDYLIQVANKTKKNLKSFSQEQVSKESEGIKSPIVYQLSSDLEHKEIKQLTDLYNKTNWTPKEFLKSLYSSANTQDRENPLTIIVKWDEWAFKIIQWDVDCQCFRALDLKNIGLHINNKGMFTIGDKHDPYSNVRKDKPECTNWQSFWWQAWNTWWRTTSYLSVPREQIGKNKFIQSNCYKYPVIILEEDEEIPYFSPKTKNLELNQESLNLSSRNTYWDKKLGRFVGQKYWEERHQKIQTYGDYLQIMNLKNLEN